MLTLLGLIGVALTAAAFSDFGLGKVPEDDHVPAEPDDPMLAGDLLTAQSVQPDDVDPAENSLGQDDGISIMSGDGDDLLFGGDSMDLLYGGAGDDELHGERGDDAIFGEDGDDLVLGYVGDDALFGGADDDTLMGGAGHDQLDGGAGDDTLMGGEGHDVLIGGAGEDMLNGGAGDDDLDGRDDSKDFLNGGAGDDLIRAGTLDHLNGGTGADTFAIPLAADAFVDDFDASEDVIELGYEGVPPELSTMDSATGLTLLADGQVVATFGGISTLDLTAVRLVPYGDAAAA